jgi:hypothetical protein
MHTTISKGFFPMARVVKNQVTYVVLDLDVPQADDTDMQCISAANINVI